MNDQQYDYESEYQASGQYTPPPYEPPHTPPQTEPGRDEAIAALVLGCISLVGWFFGLSSLISIALGIVGLVLAGKSKALGNTGGLRTAGFVLSLVGLIGGSVVFVLSLMFLGFFFHGIREFFSIAQFI